MSTMGFMSSERARTLAAEYGTPLYIYDAAALEASAKAALAFPNRFGLTVRYAMKACPTRAVIQSFANLGLAIDASSGYEAERAMLAGVAPNRIQITAQELPKNLRELVLQGVWFNATSLHQLKCYGELFPGTEVCIRVNPGLGSGHNNRTNVGGPSSSFGIWHEHLNLAQDLCEEFHLRITRLHSHVGSGGDPEVWKRCAALTMNIAAKLPDVGRVNLGGGFKVARMPGETGADVQEIGAAMLPHFERFAAEHGRELHLEIEPGTLLVANTGALIASVVDVVDTGSQGYRFIKTDTGMTENLRPSMYGAQHPIHLVPKDDTDRPPHDYMIVGHCCESGDILTPKPGDPEGLNPRTLPQARIGDLLVIGATGAYCAGMPAKNYNSFPGAAEVMIRKDGSALLIRRRQALEDVIAGEI